MKKIDDSATFFQLTNGLRVIYCREKTQTARIRLIGRTGAIWENEEEIGVAHFLEHMVFEGTEKFPTDEIVHKQLKNIGGEFNASTSFDRARYKVNVLKEDFETGMDFMSQIMLHTLLKEEAVLKEQQIINQEYLMNINSPISRFFEDAHKFMYNSHRYGLNITGETKNIMGITKTKLRSFQERNYTTPNIVVGIVADLDIKMVKDICEKYLTFEKAKKENTYEKIQKTGGKYFVGQEPTATQAIISLIFDSYDAFDDRTYYTHPMSTILGGGISSRLFNEVRQEKGLAYSVGSNLSANAFGGALTIHADFDGTKTKELIKTVKEVISKFTQKGVTDEEFNKAQKLIKSDFVFDMESITGKMNWYISRMLMGKETRSAEDLLIKELNFTKDDMHKEAKVLFEKAPTIVCYSQNLSEEEIRNYWEEA